MRRLCVLAVVCFGCFTLPLTAQTKPDKKKVLASPIPGYMHRVIEGFDVLIQDAVIEHDEDDKYKRKPTAVLELELGTITRVMPPRCVQVLRSVIIWADWDDEDDPDHGRVVAKYYGVWGNRAMWSLDANKNPLKANNVEIISLKSLTREHQPGVKHERCVILHELAHAVHLHLFGSDNPHIKAAYKQAMDRKLYDEAENVNGRKIKPYARTNEKEYFAELSCAYLNKLTYFPFNRDDLKKHDPTGYKMMEATWGTPKQIDAALKTENEKVATKKLAAAKNKQSDGKKAEAITALEKIIEYYPNTRAAAEAKPLLEKLKN
jgi:hypothetical protein